MPEYNFNFDWNRITTIGKVKVLAEQVSTPPTQEQINTAVAAYIEEHPGAVSPMSPAVKEALLQIAEKAVYIDDGGPTYYQELYDALYSAMLLSITAVYTQSGTVYDTDSLDSLKADLVVTAYYDDGTTADVTNDAVLSGTLTAGTSTITATYDGKTATFDVTVSTITILHNWDYTQSLTDTVGGVTSELTNVTQTSDGLVFNASDQHCVVGRDIMAYGRTIEVDFTDALYSAGNYTAVLWHLWNGTDVTPSGTYSTFGSRYASSASDRHIGCITTASGNWAYSSAVKTFIDGLTGTLAMTVSSDGKFKFFLNGEDLNVKKNGNDAYIDGESKIKAMTLGGHGNGSYISFYNWTVTAVRIYDGVKY